MNLKNHPMLAEAAKGRTKNIILQCLIFVLVFVVISMAQSIPAFLFLLIQGVSAALHSSAGELTPESLTAIQAQIMGSNTMALISLFSTVICTGLAVVYCRFIEKRSLRSMGIVKKNCLSQYALGCAVGFVMFSAVAGVLVLSGAGRLSFAGSVNYGLIFLFLLGYFFQGMSEEFLCRGYLMTTIGGKHGPWAGALISSVFFALLHLLNPGFGLLPFVNITLVGIFFGLYMLCFDSIWGACAVHSVWNFVQGNFYGISVSGTALQESVFTCRFTPGKELLWGGSFGAEGGLAVTGVLLLSIALLGLYMKKKSLKTEAAA